jgi:hypothetical protein
MTIRCFLSVVILVSVAALACAQESQARIYSSVEYNEEGGDLLGLEIRILPSEGHISGELKIYEGGCAQPIAVVGSLALGKLDVSGKSDAYGKIELDGTLSSEALTGTLRMEGAKPEKVRLKRISKPHC